MTQEEKELLLIDLCGRLPYEVIVGYSTKDNPNILDKIGRVIYVDIRFGMIQMQSESGTSYGLPPSEFIKPYLRPMSSMTEEEKEYYNNHLSGIITGIDAANFMIWVYSNHLDIFHLIEKGLALEAPEGMYNITK